MNATTMPFNMPTFDPQMFAGFFPMPDTMSSFAKGAMQASTESTRVSVKGMQDVTSTMMVQMKEQMTLGVETTKKISEAESVQDAMALQAGYMKAAFEANMKNFTALTELYSETMRGAFAPLAKQAKKAAKTAAKA